MLPLIWVHRNYGNAIWTFSYVAQIKQESTQHTLLQSAGQNLEIWISEYKHYIKLPLENWASLGNRFRLVWKFLMNICFSFCASFTSLSWTLKLQFEEVVHFWTPENQKSCIEYSNLMKLKMPLDITVTSSKDKRNVHSNIKIMISEIWDLECGWYY